MLPPSKTAGICLIPPSERARLARNICSVPVVELSFILVATTALQPGLFRQHLSPRKPTKKGRIRPEPLPKRKGSLLHVSTKVTFELLEEGNKLMTLGHADDGLIPIDCPKCWVPEPRNGLIHLASLGRQLIRLTRSL